MIAGLGSNINLSEIDRFQYPVNISYPVDATEAQKAQIRETYAADVAAYQQYLRNQAIIQFNQEVVAAAGTAKQKSDLADRAAMDKIDADKAATLKMIADQQAANKLAADKKAAAGKLALENKSKSTNSTMDKTTGEQGSVPATVHDMAYYTALLQAEDIYPGIANWMVLAAAAGLLWFMNKSGRK